MSSMNAPLALKDRDRARPAGGRSADLHRKAGDEKSVCRQGFEIVELLHVAVAALASGLVPFPDQRRVTGLLEALRRVNERRVPAPGIGAGHPHAALEEIKRRLAAHAAAFRHIVGAAVGSARTRVDDDDFKRLQYMADP